MYVDTVLVALTDCKSRGWSVKQGSGMEWSKLLRSQKHHDEKYEPDPFRPSYLQDIDRVIYSAPFRRLANKTQVHPLYDNDHIHHRLIHSLEVANTGRSLGRAIGAWLSQEVQAIEPSQVEELSGFTQVACMAHDIGNPPFGHSGEAAVGSWFKQNLENPAGFLADLDSKHHSEFSNFEGNAQGFRIITRTEMYKNSGGLRLSMASLGAFSKYPSSSNVSALFSSKKAPYVGLKKYGFFESDLHEFYEIAESLGLIREDVKLEAIDGYWWRRHPLSFLMEAADDISYNIMDLEDAYVAGDLPGAKVLDMLHPIKKENNKSYGDLSEADRIAKDRALAIGGAIDSCVEAFKNNYQSIMDGSFSSSLIEVSGVAEPFKLIKTVSKNEIFSAARKTELEVFGRNVIHRNLNGLLPVFQDFYRANTSNAGIAPSSYSEQVARALSLPIKDVTSPEDLTHIMADFVSGMTDRYAVKVAGMFSGG